jgi:hypothetical protein
LCAISAIAKGSFPQHRLVPSQSPIIPVAPELLVTVDCWLLKEGSKNWMIVEYWLLIRFYARRC